MSAGIAMGFPMAGTGHPLLTHGMGPTAMERFGSFLGLCLGGVERRHGFGAVEGLSEGRLRQQEGEKEGGPD